MKKFIIVLSIITLLAILFPGFSIFAQPTRTPHEDPALAEGSSDPVSLLRLFGSGFDLAAISQYQDAESLLNELEYANIPDELRYLIDRYSTLCRQLFTTLDYLEPLLAEVETLLANYQVIEAKQKLDDAETAIHDAQLLLDDIEAATNTLGDRLGVFAAVAGSEARQAYDRLGEILLRLRQLVDKLNQLRQSLTERHEIQVVELIPTELSLSITPASVFVGDSITASGRLTGDGNPLANRKLILLLDDEPLMITTDLNGSYTANITIPYKYVSTMTLNAVYIPSGDDIGVYLPGESQLVVVNTSFYTTFLEVLAPETAYPGLPITIRGQVGSSEGTIDRTVTVLLDNTQLAEEITQGQFNIQITPPPQVSTGEHSLTVTVSPQGCYAGASKSLPINIAKIPIQVEIKKPPLVLIPIPVEVSGKVHHSRGPLQDAQVRLTFRDSSTIVKTSTDGSFTTTLDMPFDLSLLGPQKLGITVEPVEPWYTPLQIEERVFTINPANIGLMLLAFVFVGLLVFRGVRTRLPSRRDKIVTPEATLQELIITVQAPRLGHDFSGIKGRILSAYLNSLGVVEKVTGITMAPHTTLREFLNAAAPQLPTAIKPFVELTLIAENALYSARKLDEATAAKAEQLAAIIKEELYGGAA